MYVSTCKGGATGQYTYVRLMESYRDENGKVKHKVVQNLGRLDILSQSDPNYLENLKKKYQEDYAEKSRLQSLNRLAQVQNLLSFDNNSSAGAPLPLLQYGHYLLKKIWDDHLHLDRKFKDIQHRQTKAKFDLNAVVSYLCFLKILDPHLFPPIPEIFLSDAVRKFLFHNLRLQSLCSDRKHTEEYNRKDCRRTLGRRNIYD